MQRLGAAGGDFDGRRINPRALIDAVALIGKNRPAHQREVGGAHVESVHAGRAAREIFRELHVGLQAFEAGLPKFEQRRHLRVAAAAQHARDVNLRLVVGQIIGRADTGRANRQRTKAGAELEGKILES